MHNWSPFTAFQFSFDLVEINTTFPASRRTAGFGAEAFEDDIGQIRYGSRKKRNEKDLLKDHGAKIGIRL